MRSFWKRQQHFPKFLPAPQQWEAGQLSRESISGAGTVKGILRKRRIGWRKSRAAKKVQVAPLIGARDKLSRQAALGGR